MADRTRRFPITEEFKLEYNPPEIYRPGDTLELRREKPTDFFKAHILRKDGGTVEIPYAVAETLFRNGALG